MKVAERIEALNIASKYEIKVAQSWWNPFSNVEWVVLKSRKKLSPEQYGYLSNNKLIELKEEIKEGEVAILKISEQGKQKLIQLQSKNK